MLECRCKGSGKAKSATMQTCNRGKGVRFRFMTSEMPLEPQSPAFPFQREIIVKIHVPCVSRSVAAAGAIVVALHLRNRQRGCDKYMVQIVHPLHFALIFVVA